MPIKVLIVDDSALIRSLLSEIIQAEDDMQVVGAAPDAFIAQDLVNRYAPDVITLDIEMPKMDGLSFLEKLMQARPTAVVMISSLTENGADATLRALEMGAIDFVTKPKLGIAQGIEEYRELIVEKIRTAASAKITNHKHQPVIRGISLNQSVTEKIIALGASTGGTEALAAFLAQLPSNSPAVLISQHMPAGFTTSFARRLNGLCKLSVSEAIDGERVMSGKVYLAPGDQHLSVEGISPKYRIRLLDTERVCGHKPSVDVMFDSLAKCAARNTVAVLMTGMGKDGAAGMLALQQNGAYTLAQDEASCVVFGMPKAAITLGAVNKVLALEELAPEVLRHLNQTG